MGKIPAYLAVLDFFETAPLVEAEHLLHHCSSLIKARKAKAESRQHRTREGGWDAWPIADKAEQILRDTATALDGRELEELIRERFGKHHSRQSIVGAVSRLAKKKKTFCRVEKGKYGLIEWQGPKGRHSYVAKALAPTEGAVPKALPAGPIGPDVDSAS